MNKNLAVINTGYSNSKNIMMNVERISTKVCFSEVDSNLAVPLYGNHSQTATCCLHRKVFNLLWFPRFYKATLCILSCESAWYHSTIQPNYTTKRLCVPV